MALTDPEVVEYVRAFTTRDTTLVPDPQILFFAGRDTGTYYTSNIDDYGLDINGVIADVWTHIATNYEYMSETHGPVSVSQPTAFRNAAYYRQQARTGGRVVEVGTLVRTDVTAAVVTVDDEEFGV
jgi:hypothetical protein